MHVSHDNSADAHDLVREDGDEDKDNVLAHMFTVNNSRKSSLVRHLTGSSDLSPNLH